MGGGGRIHPATRTFQALRRAVNEEGEEQQEAMRTAECFLEDGGVLAVISFHSGEDGLAKRYLAESAKQGNWRLQSKKPVRPTREEERRNPRARSARLRAAVRMRRSEMEAEGPKLTRDGSPAGDEEGDEEGGAGS